VVGEGFLDGGVEDASPRDRALLKKWWTPVPWGRGRSSRRRR
jgi:hypothetical protein